MNFADYTGQTLDEKYRIERELGRGGMGTVYLATHLGTERPVAVKIIAPQFMKRPEFVERFRREARTAGRLRHPNVVDVTDFGFADTIAGRVAYLVMEYLDGCTLGEILEEEQNLPVSWTLDILEQVCSAVQEAHDQGIIHRDLKPDNIWLEPNQRGGYTVKVLDFGIAKLEGTVGTDGDHSPHAFSATPTISRPSADTIADGAKDRTIVDNSSSTLVSEASTIALASESGTLVSEAGTLIQAATGSEDKTAVFSEDPTTDGDIDSLGTKLLSESVEQQLFSDGLGDPFISTGADLTRVGSVLGTPLYMSPEQCRGEHLDARSDIYSLGVIAYQMLSGSTPFTGDFKEVMEAHKELDPSPVKTKKARRKMKKAIHRALSKNPDERPLTAEAFSSEMRARSEGLLGLLRRALVIYSEHLPKFLILTTFFSLPIIALTIALITIAFLRVSDIIGETTTDIASAVVGISLSIVSLFCSYLNIGTITWVVTQYLAMPLRPVRVRPALKEARKKWKTFAGTGMLNTFMIFVAGIVGCIGGFAVGLILSLLSVPFNGWSGGQFIFAGVIGGLGGAVSFLFAHVMWALVSPVVMMENSRGWTAMRRSKNLVKRSIGTTAGASMINILIPAVLASSIAFFINVTAKAFDPKSPSATSVVKVGKVEATEPAKTVDGDAAPEGEQTEPKKTTTFGISFGDESRTEGDQDMRSRVKRTFLQSLNQFIWLPIQILVISFTAIIIALLYLKTRLSGGETTVDLMERFEDDDGPRRKWRERVRQRLIQSGRVTSKS